jgi:hypothetical protein
MTRTGKVQANKNATEASKGPAVVAVPLPYTAHHTNLPLTVALQLQACFGQLVPHKFGNIDFELIFSRQDCIVHLYTNHPSSSGFTRIYAMNLYRQSKHSLQEAASKVLLLIRSGCVQELAHGSSGALAAAS